MPNNTFSAPLVGLNLNVTKLISIAEEDLSTLSLADVCRHMMEVKAELTAVKRAATALQVYYDFLRKTKIPERMEEDGFESINVTNVGRVSLQPQLYILTVPNSQEGARQWLIDNGYGELIKETVNSSSLKAAIKECLQKGVDVPEALFKVTPYTVATITKI